MEPASSSIKDEHSNNSSSEENGFSKSQTGPSGPRRIMNFMSPGAMPHYPGVNDERMNEILNRTGKFAFSQKICLLFMTSFSSLSQATTSS